MSNWDKDISHSISMNQYLDEVYRSIYPVREIERYTRDSDAHILDKEFHIDTVIKLENGMKITSQEKVRRPNKIGWDDFTLEKDSNEYGTRGELYKLCTDIYFYAWGDKDDGLIRHRIFKVYDVKMAIINGELLGTLEKNKVHSTANFYAYPFRNFKDSWFVDKKELVE